VGVDWIDRGNREIIKVNCSDWTIVKNRLILVKYKIKILAF